jgi:hypothetical protein
MIPSKNKELVWLEGEHTQFYDSGDHIGMALKAILEFTTARVN